MFQPILAMGEDVQPVNEEPTSLTELFYAVFESAPTVVDEPQVSIIGDAYIVSHAVLQYEEPLKVGPITSKVIPLPGDIGVRYPGQCVAWVRYWAEVDYAGNAENWVAYKNSDTPHVGDVIILALSSWGHVGIVTEVKDGFVTYRSRNLLGLWIVSDSTIPIDDPTILGYITT